MSKEKTKAELLQEINEELKRKNEELGRKNNDLLSEVRQAKSSLSSFEINNERLKDLENVTLENKSLKEKIENINEELNYQNKQINVLLNGVNTLNVTVAKLFDNVNYIFKLAEENYISVFNKIQNDLDKINTNKKENKE